jgi:pimeloyl-ACP methyl ester carboxylesterase
MARTLRSAAVAVLAAGLVCGPARPAAAASAAGTTSCREVRVPVTVGRQAGAIAGTLCVPPRAATVQVLVPGNTYNRAYWQVDLEPSRYSYVRAANAAGYATLALDRLGTGASLHPTSPAMTLGNDVTTVHQVATALRRSVFGPFDRVVGVGHSLGSVVVNQVAGEHPKDFDAIVLTGFSHSINAVNATVLAGSSYVLPAGDPDFAGRHLDGFYVTTAPGARRALYVADAVARGILDWDDRNRDTGDLVEIGGLGHFQIPNRSTGISGGVFVVDGGGDPLACGLFSGDCTDSGTLQASERPWFGPGVELSAWLVPGVGHNVTLHRNAPTVTAGITAWIDRTVGVGRGRRGSTPGVVPAVAVPAPTAPEPAAAELDRALGTVAPVLVGSYRAGARGIPGLGNGTNPAPEYNRLLRALAGGVSTNVDWAVLRRPT